MAISKTTTVVKYPVAEFKSLIREKIFDGKDIKVEFVIQEVGGDSMGYYSGSPQVVSVSISFDGVGYER